MSVVEGQERLVEVPAVGGVVRVERAPVGVEKTFRAYDPEQVLLMAPVLSEWVPEGDLAHFVSDLVESGALDLSAIYASYEEECGFPPYDPCLMMKLLLYGYANGVMSSRKLEAATYRDVAVRMLCAGQHPDYRSIVQEMWRQIEAVHPGLAAFGRFVNRDTYRMGRLQSELRTEWKRESLANA